MLRQTKQLLLVAFFLFSSLAFGDSFARIVRLSYIEGDVQMDRNDDRGYGRAFLNSPVIEGSRVSTGSDGRAEIEFEDGSTVRLLADTTVDFRELRLRGNSG